MEPTQTPTLEVLGATYGPANVTDNVRALIKDNGLKFTVSNSILGDPWFGVVKSFMVVYKYGNSLSITKIFKENESFEIKYDMNQDIPDATNYQEGGFYILGASYGLGDVTTKCRSNIQDKKLKVTANNKTFCDYWYGTKKILSVVYKDGKSSIKVATAKENEGLSIS